MPCRRDLRQRTMNLGDCPSTPQAADHIFLRSLESWPQGSFLPRTELRLQMIICFSDSESSLTRPEPSTLPICPENPEKMGRRETVYCCGVAMTVMTTAVIISSNIRTVGWGVAFAAQSSPSVWQAASALSGQHSASGGSSLQRLSSYCCSACQRSWLAWGADRVSRSLRWSLEINFFRLDNLRNLSHSDC